MTITDQPLESKDQSSGPSTGFTTDLSGNIWLLGLQTSAQRSCQSSTAGDAAFGSRRDDVDDAPGDDTSSSPYSETESRAEGAPDTTAPADRKIETPLLLKGKRDIAPHEQRFFASQWNRLSASERKDIADLFNELGLKGVPVTAETVGTVARNLIAQLESGRYSQRVQGEQGLKRLGSLACPAMAEARLRGGVTDGEGRFQKLDYESNRRMKPLWDGIVRASRSDIQAEERLFDSYSKRAKVATAEGRLQLQGQLLVRPDVRPTAQNQELTELIRATGKHLARLSTEGRGQLIKATTNFARSVDATESAERLNERRAQLRLQYIESHLNADPRHVSAQDRAIAAEHLAEVLRNPRALSGNDGNNDLSVRTIMADLRYLNHPQVPILEQAYQRAGGDMRKMMSTTSNFHFQRLRPSSQ